MTTTPRYDVLMFTPAAGTRVYFRNLPWTLASIQAGELAERFPDARFFLAQANQG